MAETFNTADLAVTSTETTLYTAPSSAGDISIILSLRVTNIDGTNDDQVTVNIYESDGTTKKASIASTMTVPADSSLELAGTSKIVLEQSEVVKIQGVAASGDLEAYLSCLEITAQKGLIMPKGYGYTGALPDQNTAQNSGVFEVNDIVDLQANNGWTLQDYAVQYLVIAGGGGGGGGNIQGGGGGGAGGYRNSYASESSGGGNSTETPLTITPNTEYTVTVGGGGSAVTSATRGNSGSNSVFASITSNGGGGGGSQSGSGRSGGSGGGGTAYGGGGAGGTANQGYAGGNGLFGPGVCPNHYLGGGGGGGAAEVGEAAGCAGGAYDGGDGLSSSITGTSVGRGGGGFGSNNDTTSNGSGVTTWGGGKARAGTSAVTSTSGSTNKGGGGGGACASGSAVSGAGGSGIVIIRVPLDWSISGGAGLTKSETLDYANHEKIIQFTAGTATDVSFS